MSNEQPVTTGSAPSSAPASAPSLGEQLRSNLSRVYSKEPSEQAPQAVSTNASTEPNRGEVQEAKDPIEESNQPEQDQSPEQDQTNAANLDPESNKPKQHVSRGEKRFQQMANEIKELKAMLEQKAAGKEGEPTAQEKPALVPKPAPPAFSKDQLDQAEAIAKQTGNEELMRSVMEEREKARQYAIDERFWKLENEKKLQEYESTVNHYRAEAVKKWPDLAKTESPLFQMYQKVVSQAPELLKREKGDGEYIAAEVAATFIRNQELESKLAALEQKTKQTETENNGLKKKIAPVVQKQSLNVGASNTRKMTAGEELRARMSELQQAGMLGR